MKQNLFKKLLYDNIWELECYFQRTDLGSNFFSSVNDNMALSKSLGPLGAKINGIIILIL